MPAYMSRSSLLHSMHARFCRVHKTKNARCAKHDLRQAALSSTRRPPAADHAAKPRAAAAATRAAHHKAARRGGRRLPQTAARLFGRCVALPAAAAAAKGARGFGARGAHPLPLSARRLLRSGVEPRLIIEDCEV